MVSQPQITNNRKNFWHYGTLKHNYSNNSPWGYWADEFHSVCVILFQPLVHNSSCAQTWSHKTLTSTVTWMVAVAVRGTTPESVAVTCKVISWYMFSWLMAKQWTIPVVLSIWNLSASAEVSLLGDELRTTRLYVMPAFSGASSASCAYMEIQHTHIQITQ